MKKLLLLIASIIVSFSIKANPISDSLAKVVGLNFINNKAVNPIGKIEQGGMKLSFTAKGTQNYYYVFNIYGNKGFVIVAADDNALPILGYSFNNGFDTSRLNTSVADWLEGYQKQMQYIIENNILQTEEIKVKWEELLNSSSNNNSNGNRARAQIGIQPQNGIVVGVLPLTTTLWDQNPGDNIYFDSTINTHIKDGNYNLLCPYDSVNNGRCVTGCVATAMAQVLKKWNYPTQGNNFHYYTPANSKLGLQFANFSNTTYDWSNMPDSLTTTSTTTQTNAVATLMYHCGISVNMAYGKTESSAWAVTGVNTGTNTAQYAFKTYFGYDSIKGLTRGNLSDAIWLNTIENQLNLKQPVIHTGSGTNGGHCFVADGYDSYNLIHFNWGWSGICNGYFQIDALNPGTLGTGGGTGGFNSGQQAIINIYPTPQPTYDISLYYSEVTPSTSTIGYGAGFTVTTNIGNNGTNSFQGDICAAVFDANANFVSYVAIDSNYTLPANSHFTNNLTFTTTGIFAMVPGNYTIYIYYRPTGGNWVSVSNSLLIYTNSASITVVNDNAIALYAPIITSGNLVQSQSATVNLNIINNGSSTFNGTYEVALYTLSGNFVQSFGTLTATNGLASGYHYTSDLTFNTTSITATPGSYLLALMYQPTGGSWYVAGNGSYENPIIVNVQPAPLLPDIYEPDDSISQSYSLPITFVNNNAYLNTVGSNIHIGTDQDFYKIVLPKGYYYFIKPNLNDVYYSDNANTYSLDGIFSFSTDSVNWSGTYNDTIPGNITVAGGHTLFLHVSPSYQGETGTYLLEANIHRVLNDTVKLSGCGSVVYNGKSYTSTSFFTNPVNISESDTIIHTVQIYVSPSPIVYSIIGTSSVCINNTTMFSDSSNVNKYEGRYRLYSGFTRSDYPNYTGVSNSPTGYYNSYYLKSNSKNVIDANIFESAYGYITSQIYYITGSGFVYSSSVAPRITIDSLNNVSVTSGNPISTPVVITQNATDLANSKYYPNGITSITKTIGFKTIVAQFRWTSNGIDKIYTDTFVCISDSTYGFNWLSNNSKAYVNNTGLVTGLVNGWDTINYNVKNAYGCISSATKVVYINPAAIIKPININGCNSVTYKGITYTSSAIERDTVRSVQGCDSIYNVATITINKITPVISDTVFYSCNSIIFNNITYNTTTNFIDTIRTINGCDSVYLTVNINIVNIGISGGIKHPSKGYVIPNVSAMISGTNVINNISTDNYAFNCLPQAANETIRLYKNNDLDKANGVTTLDIALTQAHILQKNLLNSPFKIIAADVNGDSKVTALDIVYMKRLVLGIDTTFTNSTTKQTRLWAFVDSTYKFPDTTNPFPIKDSISYTGLNANQTNQTFIGCKLGDVNWDWNPAIPRPMVNNINAVELSYNPVNANNEKIIRIPIKVNNFRDMQGIQYTINFNPAVLKWVGVNNNVLNFEMGTNHSAVGKVSFLWVDAKNEVKTLDDGSVLFDLVFEKSADCINEQLDLDGSITAVVAYDKDYQSHNVIFKPSVINSVDTKDNWIVAPNPTKDGVIKVQMNLKNSKTVVFRLSDNTGRILLVKKIEVVKGTNNITLKEGNIPEGTYYLQAMGVECEDVKKIIVN